MELWDQRRGRGGPPLATGESWDMRCFVRAGGATLAKMRCWHAHYDTEIKLS
jgi:hypothetical protein